MLDTTGEGEAHVFLHVAKIEIIMLHISASAALMDVREGMLGHKHMHAYTHIKAHIQTYMYE